MGDPVEVDPTPAGDLRTAYDALRAQCPAAREDGSWVVLVGVVGNEDGAHHTTAECLQALNDTGFSVAAAAGTSWVGEAMQGTDYQDLDPEPETTATTTATAARNAVHLARLLRSRQYPA